MNTARQSGKRKQKGLTAKYAKYAKGGTDKVDLERVVAEQDRFGHGRRGESRKWGE
jgi:hypothetical protein